MLLPVAAVAIYEMNASAIVSPNGDIDDAGQRSAGLFFVALPFLYVFAVLLCFGAGQLLVRSGLRRLWHYLAAAAAVSLLIAAPAARVASYPEKFGWSDTLIAFLVIGVLLLTCTGLGVACWWWLAVHPRNFSAEDYPNQSLEPTAGRCDE